MKIIFNSKSGGIKKCILESLVQIVLLAFMNFSGFYNMYYYTH